MNTKCAKYEIVLNHENVTGVTGLLGKNGVILNKYISKHSSKQDKYTSSLRRQL